jgi:hypothetical protein
VIRRRPWTEAEEDALRAAYPARSDEALARRLGRTPKAIAHRRERLGLVNRTAKPWTIGEREALISMYGAYTAEEIAKHLGRTQAAIHYQVHALGLPHWTTAGDKPCVS